MRTVLIIDDEWIARSMLAESISWQDYGYRICGEAANGKEGLEKTLELHPDLIFVDIKMPVMDGLDFLREVHDFQLFCKCVMLTCYNEFDYVQEAMRLGAVDYLIKHTFESQELITLLSRLEPLYQRDELNQMGRELLSYDVLHRLIESKLTEEEIEHYVTSGLLPARVPHYMVASYCFRQELSPIQEKQLSMLFQNLQNLTNKWNFIEAVTPLLYNSRYYLFLFMNKDASAGEAKSDLQRFLCLVSDKLEEMNIICITGITKKLYVGWKSLPYSVKETSDSLLVNAKYLQCSAKTLKALEYIKENYSKPLSLEEISEAVGLSRIYLSQLFKKETGMNLSDYLTEYRITMAKNLLLTSNLKVYDISDLCGFSSTTYFSTIFKKLTGVSPNQFKNNESHNKL